MTRLSPAAALVRTDHGQAVFNRVMEGREDLGGLCKSYFVLPQRKPSPR